MNMEEYLPIHFRIGEFMANLHLSGIYHPDLKLDNIGRREDGKLIILDAADMKLLKFPFDIKKKEKSIMNAIRGYNNYEKSLFRLGYILRGGKFAEIIFNNLSTSKNFNSFNIESITYAEDKNIKYNDVFSVEVLNATKKWKRQNLDKLYEQEENFNMISSIYNQNNYTKIRYCLCIMYLCINELTIKPTVTKAKEDLLLRIIKLEYNKQNIVLCFGFIEYYLLIFSMCSSNLNTCKGFNYITNLKESLSKKKLVSENIDFFKKNIKVSDSVSMLYWKLSDLHQKINI